MARSLLGLLGCLLAAGFAVSGCGNPGRTDTSAGTAWADKACGSIVQLQNLKDRQPAIELADLAAAKRAISTFYGEAVVAAGPSPLPNGADAAAKFTTLLEQVKYTAATARNKIADADPDDAQRFGTTLAQIATALGVNLQKSSTVVTELNSNREFRTAAAAAPKCQQLQRPPTGAPSR